MVNNLYVTPGICRCQGQCMSTGMCRFKPVDFLLVMLSLLLEDTFDVFLFSRSDLQTTGAFWALHYSLM